MEDNTVSSPSPTLPLHFSRLSILAQQYLVCCGSGSLYLFHSSSYQLSGWTEALEQQDQVYCDGHSLWVLKEGGRALYSLEFADISTSVQRLVELGLVSQALQV